MTALRSIAFNILFYAWTGVCTLLTLLTLPFPLQFGYYPQTCWAWGSQKLLCVAGIKLEIRGSGNIPEKQPVLIASKHQSALETTVFFSIAPKVAVVVKKELLKIPVFGWYLSKMKEITIDRGAGGAALKKLIRAGREAVLSQRSILIFPEGTRTAVGKTGTYHPGVFALYNMLKLPAVPVALNSGLFWPRRKFMKYPGTIIIEILPPIPPGLGREAFMKRLEGDIEGATKRLIAESKKP